MVLNCIKDCKPCKLKTYLNINWHTKLEHEFDKDYFIKIIQHLHSKETIYPPIDKIFSFASFFNINDTRVVIIGQDPYHKYKQANGLAFSVDKSCKIPPSLRNIYKELNIKKGTCGDLTPWVKQGVLLLNNCLTVFEGKPNSHKLYGWCHFVNSILKVINEECENVVFILWGRNAWEKEEFVDSKKHCLLKAAHPSPLSASRGFFGSNHFNLANEYLKLNNKEGIDWTL